MHSVSSHSWRIAGAGCPSQPLSSTSPPSRALKEREGRGGGDDSRLPALPLPLLPHQHHHRSILPPRLHPPCPLSPRHCRLCPRRRPWQVPRHVPCGSVGHPLIHRVHRRKEVSWAKLNLPSPASYATSGDSRRKEERGHGGEEARCGDVLLHLERVGGCARCHRGVTEMWN